MALNSRLRFGWPVAWLAVMALLASCATAPRPPDTLLDVAAQREFIASLDSYRFEGRVAVAAGSEGFNASLGWTQAGSGSTVRLTGPLGAGSLRVHFDDDQLRVESSRGQVLEGEEAQGALREQLGFAPPLDDLRYWLLGRPAPGGEALEERDSGGQLLTLTQHGWRIEYQEYLPQQATMGVVSLPTRLRATREDLRLRVVIDRWRLGH